MRLVLFLLLLASPLLAADPIAGPAELKRDRVGVYKVATGGKLLVKVPAGLDVQKSPDGGTWYVAGKPGTYKLSGNYFTVDFEKKTWDVQEVELDLRVVDDAPPAPVPPPVPPEPTDPLLPKLKAAFVGQSKADASALAAVYRVAARDGGVVDSAATTKPLLAVMHAAAESVCPLPKLQAVREIIATELDAVLGTTDGPLLPLLRDTTKAQFIRLAALLEALK